jgi:hypothetical protein
VDPLQRVVVAQGMQSMFNERHPALPSERSPTQEPYRTRGQRRSAVAGGAQGGTRTHTP